MKILDGLFASRRVIRAIESIAESQRQQTKLFAQLVARLAPEPDVILDEKSVRTVTEISYSRDVEQVAIEDFIQRVFSATGHTPTDDEIIAHLDERFGTRGAIAQ